MKWEVIERSISPKHFLVYGQQTLFDPGIWIKQ